MGEEHMVMAGRLLASVLAGGLIGLERSYRGRPAGFRTHTLVCMASTVLMLITVYEWQWIEATADSIRMDPTRMAQGIMTGIGFLGAGVIFKEGITVRGLTTAASIWITAALGILIGIGFYFPATVTTALVLFVLSIFRWIESRMHTQNYARLDVGFSRAAPLDEEALRAELSRNGFDTAPVHYRVSETDNRFEYRLMIQTTKPENFGKLAQALCANPLVKEFRIAPTGD
ncbi:MAG TPA: MgtC/SapB family protein [Burkholderiales bacterium]|nr:MgtC/SapB family protein [Burkholderiales bacterium]